MPKVSIIVIIYKVGAYLSQCLESLMNQTYENIEIICVVGKGDIVCEQICEEYSKKDSRFVVLVKEPQGTAVARNQGLEAACGDFIGFVDGDDYAASDMIEVMVEAALRTNAQISIVGKYYAYQNCIDGDTANTEQILNCEQAFETILYQDGFFLHIWDKLYRRELFEGIRFPVGKLVEDRQIACKLLMQADTIVYNSASKYYFRVSEDSGSRVEKNLKLSLQADYEFCDMIQKRYPGLCEAIEFFLVYENMSVIQNSILFGTYSKEHDREYLDYVRQHAKNTFANHRVSKSIKLKMLLCNYCQPVFHYLTTSRRKKFLKNHISFTLGADWESVFSKQGVKS